MGVEKWDLFNTALVYFRCVQVQRWVGFIDFWCAEGTNNKLLPGGPSITFGRCAVFQLNNNCWDGLLWHWRVAKESYSQRQGTEVGEKFISGECAWYICVYRNLAKCSIETYLRDTLYIHDPSIHTSTLLLLLDLSPGNKGETTYSACLACCPPNCQNKQICFPCVCLAHITFRDPRNRSILTGIYVIEFRSRGQTDSSVPRFVVSINFFWRGLLRQCFIYVSSITGRFQV